MEIVAFVLMLAMLVFGSLVVVGIAGAGGKSELEDKAQFEHFNPSSERADALIEEPSPFPASVAKKPAAKIPQDDARRDDSQRTLLAGSVMKKDLHFCREDQSVDEIRRIMRERHVESLVVLDRNSRAVGVVRMRDLPDENRSSGHLG